MSASPITSTLAVLLENAARTALDLDPAARAQIAKLDQQLLLVELSLLPTAGQDNSSPQAALRILCSAADGGTLSVMADSKHNTQSPHAIVRGSLASFMQALRRTDGHDLPDGIDIEGDERLLLALQNCFGNLQPNWREPLDNFAATFSERFGSGTTNSNAPPLIQDLLGQAELTFATLRTAITDVVSGSKDSASEASAKFWAREDDLEAFASRLENLQMNVDRLRADISLRHNENSTNKSPKTE